METHRIEQQVTYENSDKILNQISQVIEKQEQLKLEIGKITFNTPLKAVLRKVVELFPDRVVLDEALKKRIEYDKEKTPEDVYGKEVKPFLDRLGDKVYVIYQQVYYFFVIIVDMLFYAFQSLYNRRHIVKYDTMKNAYYIGYKAIPIVFLLSFLIGLTLTVQAAIQMAKFGGQGYLATLIGVAMLTELGPLITAIVISGRTGSSIAAEIGTMKVMEEVDALKTMGVRPLKFLLVPKFWAFTLAMPILTLFADFSGIFGGMLVASAYNVPAGAFIEQLISVMRLEDIFWGTVKSLSFSWVILAVASYKGLNVRGGADAVGRATTESVVVSIFMVVVIDAIFSLIIYT